jgi:hypothetical protein
MPKRVIALYLYLSYKLETHYVLQVSLKNWLWLAIVGPPALAFLRQTSWLLALLISTASALLLVGTRWARHKQYVVLMPAESQARDAPRNLAPIQVDEQTRCRAFGRFAVQGRERYVINEDAQISFVRTLEHIVMAYVRRTRFLLLAASAKQDVGWWYVFVIPERLQEVCLASLSYGFKTETALIIRYKSEQEPEQVQELYLAFEDMEARQRVLDDLRRALAL